MIPNHRLNEAYDFLNLPRDASAQAVRDRAQLLRERYINEPEKLIRVNELFAVLEQADAIKRAQRDMIAMSTRSKGERDLDGHLMKLTVENAASTGVKRQSESRLDDVKKLKLEEVKNVMDGQSVGSIADPGDEQVFSRINNLLRDEAKYLRAVNVLFNVVSSLTDKAKFDISNIRMVIDSVDVACTATASSVTGIPLANLNEDNRKAVTKVVNLVMASDGLLSHINNVDKTVAKFWSHAVIFRNSLFEFDNFNYLKKCKELVNLVKESQTLGDKDEDQRFRKEILITIETLCSKNVCRTISGRIADTKTNMTEIYRISRHASFPVSFRDRVAEIQKELMSS